MPAGLATESVRMEIPDILAYTTAAGLSLDSSTITAEDPRFVVAFRNGDGESFFAEFSCHDYPMNPPMIEFVDESRHVRGEKRLYPACFHGMPCVCARYSRKAYQRHGGPHADWRMLDWQLPTTNGIAIDTITMMISDMHSKIMSSTGRLT
jgi:hypothetical protein